MSKMTWSEIFQSEDWIRLKNPNYSETNPLSRSEFVKEYGHKNFTEEKYREYLKKINKKVIQNDTTGTFNF